MQLTDPVNAVNIDILSLGGAQKRSTAADDHIKIARSHQEHTGDAPYGAPTIVHLLVIKTGDLV